MPAFCLALLYVLAASPAHAAGSAVYGSFKANGVPVLSIYVSTHSDLCKAMQGRRFPAHAETTWLGAYTAGGTPSQAYFIVDSDVFQAYAQAVDDQPGERLVASQFTVDSHHRATQVRHAQRGTLYVAAGETASHEPLEGRAVLFYPGQPASVVTFTATYCPFVGG